MPWRVERRYIDQIPSWGDNRVVRTLRAQKYGVQLRNMRLRMLLALVSVMVFCAVAAPPASAVEPDCMQQAVPGCSTSAVGFPGYKGWGSVSGSIDVPAWLWSETGWVATTLRGSESVYLYPYGSGWTWVWSSRLNTWAAAQSSYLAIPTNSLFPSSSTYNRPYFEVGMPTGTWAGKAPRGVMIYIHGGGFFGDDPVRVIERRGGAARWRGRGWMTVNIDYRTGKPGFYDVSAFYEAVRANISPTTKICAAGDSAGAHHSLMLAVYRPQLSCVIAMAGAADLSTLPTLVRTTFALSSLSEADLKALSPLTYASSIRARVFMATGANDATTPAVQVTMMAAARPDFSTMILATPGPIPFVHTYITESAFVSYLNSESVFSETVLAS